MVTFIALVQGREERVLGKLTDTDESGQTTERTVEVRRVIWPTLPGSPSVMPVATNPSNPLQQIWVISGKNNPNFWNHVRTIDITRVIELYRQWTGAEAPEEWLQMPAVEL